MANMDQYIASNFRPVNQLALSLCCNSPKDTASINSHGLTRTKTRAPTPAIIRKRGLCVTNAQKPLSQRVFLQNVAIIYFSNFTCVGLGSLQCNGWYLAFEKDAISIKSFTIYEAFKCVHTWPGKHEILQSEHLRALLCKNIHSSFSDVAATACTWLHSK